MGERQTATLGRLGWTLVAVLALAGIALGLSGFRTDSLGLLIAAAILLACAALVASIRVTSAVESSELVVSLRPFARRRIPLADIDEIEVVRRQGWQGVGWRRFGRKQWGYLAGGPELVVVYDDDHTLRFSVPEPERMRAAVLDRLP